MRFKFKGPADHLILVFSPQKKIQIFIKVEEPNNVSVTDQTTFQTQEKPE